MAKDVEQHCRECIKCQKTKPTLPQKAPLINVPIGRPWQVIAVDILEVPVSCHNNRYLLVIQDFFTKWPEVIPPPDQKASRITTEMIKFFSAFGLPDVLHSDQGRNFESAILRQTLDAFGITKSHTSAYHPQGDGMVECFNRSLLQMLRAFVDKNADWERYLPLMLYAYRTAVNSSTGATAFSSCSADLLRHHHPHQQPPSTWSPIQLTCKPSLWKCTTLCRSKRQQLLGDRNNNMMSVLKNVIFMWETQFGSPYPLLASLIHDGKENGLSEQSRTL